MMGVKNHEVLNPIVLEKRKTSNNYLFFPDFYDEIATIPRVERLIASKSEIITKTFYGNKIKIEGQPYFFFFDLDFDLPKNLLKLFKKTFFKNHEDMIYRMKLTLNDF